FPQPQTRPGQILKLPQLTRSPGTVTNNKACRLLEYSLVFIDACWAFAYHVVEELVALCRCRCGLIGPVKPLPCVGIDGAHHFVDLFFCLFFGHSVTFLKQTNELLASSSRALQIVI